VYFAEWWEWDDDVDEMDKSWLRKVHDYFDEHSFEVFYYGHLYPAVTITAFAFFSRFTVFVFSAPFWFMWFLGVLIDRFYFTITYRDLPGIDSADSPTTSPRSDSVLGAAAHGVLGAEYDHDYTSGKKSEEPGFVQLDNSSPEGVILLALPNPIVAESTNGIDPPRRRFHYEAGQVAFLNCPLLGKLIDRDGDRDGVLGAEWHPFSIASSPNQPTLQFIIGPQKEHSWTARLKEAIHHRFQVTASGQSKLKRIPLKVMGPFGGSFTKADQFDCLCLFGGGTGLTNSLSVLRRIVFGRKDEMWRRIALYNTILEKNGKVFGKNLPWLVEAFAEEEIPLDFVKDESIKKKVFLVWSTSDVYALVWSFERLGEILCSKDHMEESDINNLNKWLNVKIFCSRAKSEKERSLFYNLKSDKLFPNNYLSQGLKLQSLRSQSVIHEIFTDIKRQSIGFAQNNPECNSNLKMFFCGPNAMRLNILKFLEKEDDQSWSIEANTENFG
jgi:predicted ferric reductase